MFKFATTSPGNASDHARYAAPKSAGSVPINVQDAMTAMSFYATTAWRFALHAIISFARISPGNAFDFARYAAPKSARSAPMNVHDAMSFYATTVLRLALHVRRSCVGADIKWEPYPGEIPIVKNVVTHPAIYAKQKYVLDAAYSVKAAA